jgi:tetratricopeptide (TPR) repeat protein
MLLIVILALLLTGSHFNGTSVHNTLSRFTNVMTDSSVQSRLDIWKMSIEGIKARPFLGWGQENFIGIYTVNPIPLVDSQVWMDRAHNIIIDWTVNAGIMGLVSYLLIFAGAFYSLRSALKARSMSYVENIVIVTTSSVYFLHNLFIFDTINTYVLFFTLLSYVSHGASANEPFVMNNSFGTPSRKEDIKLISITCVTLLTFSLACYFLHYRPIKGLQLSLRASKSVSPSSSYSHLLNDFNKALSSSPFIVRDVLLQMTQVSDYIFRYKLFSNVAALSFIDKNAKKLESSISANSFNLQYLSLITNFYFKIANYEPAFIEVTERLIKKNIHINSQYEWLNIILADVQILKGNYVDAVKNMQSIVDKDPMNDQKRIYLLIAAIIANKDIIAEDSLKKIKDLRLRRFKNEMTDNSQIFSIYELHLIARAYSKRADYFIAIQNYKDITRILSNKETLYKDSDFQYTKPYFKALVHFETAQNYIYINDEENALKEVKKAMKLDPLSFSDAIDWLYN